MQYFSLHTLLPLACILTFCHGQRLCYYEAGPIAIASSDGPCTNRTTVLLGYTTATGRWSTETTTTVQCMGSKSTLTTSPAKPALSLPRLSGSEKETTSPKSTSPASSPPSPPKETTSPSPTKADPPQSSVPTSTTSQQTSSTSSCYPKPSDLSKPVDDVPDPWLWCDTDPSTCINYWIGQQKNALNLRNQEAQNAEYKCHHNCGLPGSACTRKRDTLPENPDLDPADYLKNRIEEGRRTRESAQEHKADGSWKSHVTRSLKYIRGWVPPIDKDESVKRGDIHTSDEQTRSEGTTVLGKRCSAGEESYQENAGFEEEDCWG